MNLFDRYPELVGQKENIEKAIELIVNSHERGGKVLLAGNGGSAADCAHIAGELNKSFLLPRPLDVRLKENLINQGERGAALAEKLQSGIAAVDLTAMSACISAFANDVSADAAYAQLLSALSSPQDVFVGISTSGNSQNVVNAFVLAKAAGLKSVALTGEKRSECMSIADVTVAVPASETYLVQEYHLPVYHYICAEVERRLFERR